MWNIVRQLNGVFNRNETIHLMNLLAYQRFLTRLIHFYKSISYQQREPASFPLFRNFLTTGRSSELPLPALRYRIYSV